jgi:hypothetical protein
VVGIVAACIVAFLLGAVITIIIQKKRRRQKEAARYDAATGLLLHDSGMKSFSPDVDMSHIDSPYEGGLYNSQPAPENVSPEIYGVDAYWPQASPVAS